MYKNRIIGVLFNERKVYRHSYYTKNVLYLTTKYNYNYTAKEKIVGKKHL